MQPFIASKREEIAELCRRHHVRRLSIFGSAARDDFDPAHSDIDILVEFAPFTGTSYTKNFWNLEEELQSVLQRKVDLVRDGVITNPYILRTIHEDKVDLYAA